MLHLAAPVHAKADAVSNSRKTAGCALRPSLEAHRALLRVQVGTIVRAGSKSGHVIGTRVGVGAQVGP